MKNLRLRLVLKSDGCFGRGDGVAGLVDVEVQHDRYGCPYLNGRTLRGLLVEECTTILDALERQAKLTTAWTEAAQNLFGRPGSQLVDQSYLRIGAAKLPEDLRRAVVVGIQRRDFTAAQVLDSLTTIRRQTSIDVESGAAQEKTLRSLRLVLRGTVLEAGLVFTQEPGDLELPLLAACVQALRRAGTGRNRGQGELSAQLFDSQAQDITTAQFAMFCEQLEVAL